MSIDDGLQLYDVSMQLSERVTLEITSFEFVCWMLPAIVSYEKIIFIVFAFDALVARFSDFDENLLI